MRILVINYEFPPLGGGAGNATACLAREWAAAGHEVTVLTGGFRGLAAREKVDGFSVRRLPTPRREQGRCSVGEMCAFLAASCAAVLAGPRPDVAVAFFSIPCGPAALLLNVLRGVPYVVSLRGGDVPGFDAQNLAGLHTLTNPATALVWRAAAAVVGNSAGLCALARDFAPELAVPEIPNGVDTARFSPGGGGEKGAVELLFVGRLAGQKGVAILIEALRSCPRGWRLRIAGDGPERARLEALAAGLSVEFLGWVQRDALPALYRSADVFVFPSLDEGMPNVVLEAMASGLPIVATRIAGNAQLVLDGANGALVPPGDAAAFAKALTPFLRDAPLRAAAGAASRKLAVERYSWRSAAGRYVEIFQSCTKEAGR